jgi:hypothetical protein
MAAGKKPSKLDLHIYEDLRTRLIDKTRRNRLLNFRHAARSSLIRVVDELPDKILDHLLDSGTFRFRSLPDPEVDPADERAPKFRSALALRRTAWSMRLVRELIRARLNRCSRRLTRALMLLLERTRKRENQTVHRIWRLLVSIRLSGTFATISFCVICPEASRIVAY